MRLIRFGKAGHEKPGVMGSGEERLDCSKYFKDWDREFFESGGLAKLATFLRQKQGKLKPVPARERWGAPVSRPGKVICIGLNYKDHAAESGMELPKEPVIFMKASNVVVGPYDTVLIPRGGHKTDWEVELGVVIGKKARYLKSAADSAKHVAGYLISNDVSERAFQIERCGQWTKGKSCDTFSPLGPWLTTRNEIPDPQDLGMRLDVNGVRRQNGSTATMAYGVFFLVHYLSQFMTLEGGDVISTGTPPGVGMGMKPPQFLKAGDVMELEVDHLGSQRQVCKQA